MARRHRERPDWTAASAEQGVFEREILPGIQSIPLAELQRATGLSHTYVSAIRRGVYVPHPQHWPAFRHLTEASAGTDRNVPWQTGHPRRSKSGG
jgi:hypothetical protein